MLRDKKNRNRPLGGRGFNVYRGPFTQEGYGIGSVFKKFFKWLGPIIKREALPILKTGAQSLGEEIIKTGSNMAIEKIKGKDNIIENNIIKPAKNIIPKIKKRSKKVVEELINLSSNIAKDSIKGVNLKESAEKNIKKTISTIAQGQKVLDDRDVNSKEQLKRQANASDLLGLGIKRKLIKKGTIILKKK